MCPDTLQRKLTPSAQSRPSYTLSRRTKKSRPRPPKIHTITTSPTPIITLNKTTPPHIALFIPLLTKQRNHYLSLHYIRNEKPQPIRTMYSLRWPTPLDISYLIRGWCPWHHFRGKQPKLHSPSQRLPWYHTIEAMFPHELHPTISTPTHQNPRFQQTQKRQPTPNHQQRFHHRTQYSRGRSKVAQNEPRKPPIPILPNALQVLWYTRKPFLCPKNSSIRRHDNTRRKTVRTTPTQPLRVMARIQNLSKRSEKTPRLT